MRLKNTLQIVIIGLVTFLLSSCSMTPEQLRALSDALNGIGDSARSYQAPTNTYTAPSVNFGNTQNQRSGTPIYDANRCIGSVVNGQCMGTIRPSGEVQKRCYGAVVNGRCTGSIGY